jgi:hypothetical protein
MKFVLSAPLLVLAAMTAELAAADEWKCNGWWKDGGLRRYSWQFKGYCENRYGQCFLDVLRGKGLADHNWQCWDTGNDGWWQADVSFTAGLAWQINNGINEITGTNLGCWPNA